MKGKTAVGCSDFKVCGFKVPFELMGKKLTDKQLSDLITNKKTGIIKGIKHPSGIEKGRFILDDTFNISFQE